MDKKIKVYEVYEKRNYTVFDRLLNKPIEKKVWCVAYLTTKKTSAESYAYSFGGEVKYKERKVTSYELSDMLDRMDCDVLGLNGFYEKSEFNDFGKLFNNCGE